MLHISQAHVTLIIINHYSKLAQDKTRFPAPTTAMLLFTPTCLSLLLLIFSVMGEDLDAYERAPGLTQSQRKTRKANQSISLAQRSKQVKEKEDEMKLKEGIEVNKYMHNM
jgi:hypothetical protein